MAAKSSNKIWWILGGVVVLLVAFLLLAKSQGWIGKEKAAEVVFAKVKRGDIIERVSASGKVQPEIEVKITPDVPGEIIELTVEEGDSVVKGQLLAKIRPDNYVSLTARATATVNSSKATGEQTKALLAQAEARLIRVKTDYERQKKLFNEKVISEADFELAEANYKVAKQELESAKANVETARYNVQSAEAGLRDASENLRKTTIYAPANGIVSKLGVELGERVVGTSQMSGTEMMRIANLNNMEVRVNVNENDIVRVSLGDSVIIDVDAYSATGRKFKGIVTEIANTANGSGSLSAAASSTDAVTEFEVKIRILRNSYADLIDRKNKKAFPFRPGMTASVEIITDRKANILTVPLASVTTRQNDDKLSSKDTDKEKNKEEGNDEKKKAPKKGAVKEVVFVNKNGKADMRTVKTGISDFDNIEILSGLKEGEEIIAGPYKAVSKDLKNGDAVMLKKEGEKKE